MTLHESTALTLKTLTVLVEANLEMQKALGLVISALALKAGGEVRIPQADIKTVAESGEWALCLKQEDDVLVLRIASKERVEELKHDYKVVQLT